MISEQWKHMSDEQKEASRVICLTMSFPFLKRATQTYNQAMKMAKAQYSEEKKAYDSRTPEEIQAANAAAAAALLVRLASLAIHTPPLLT
jgi:UDP-N-acetylmuramyl tripeptide synthase